MLRRARPRGPRGYALDMSTAEERVASAPVEDYVKAIYSLTRTGVGAASTTALAGRLGITPGSVSTMVKRLDSHGLVQHVPYHGVKLTAAGEQLALGVIRRHRLVELFLHEALGIAWEDVDRFAERLEHAVSDELIEIIATRLGDPAIDPHGDPIPTRALEIDDRATRRLDELELGERATLVRVSDSDPEMLRYLTEQGIAIGDRVEMLGRQPFDGPCEVRIAGRTHLLGLALARVIRVR